ncbi:MAG: sirohydrochlorin chelatase [Sulfobacillus thermotolerans]|uniref:Sirohydrochlorin chelatase n=1 Tax=Sulfobacillus thermotolerans TaxID=338644 RepID=A0ABN5H1W4_9FIRM|nr:hypothetical protein BXT84_08910 [Sulfobacillus thermotolerans]MCY0908993.1 sirohydrochlorin chelatase [Sulfobacillus thermotolerans]
MLLIGHGSQDAEGSQQFDEMARQVAQRLQQSHSIPVHRAFLEFAEPAIGPYIDVLVAEGTMQITAVPVMLLDAGHCMEDIPHVLHASLHRHNGLQIHYGNHLGFHPALQDVLLRRLAPYPPTPQTGILFVGRGSSDPVANAHFYQLSRMLWERTQYEWIENAFIGITFPRMAEGLERLYRLGMRRVVVVPYFLFTGTLFKKIKAIAQQFAADHHGVEVAVTDYFGLENDVIEVVVQRVTEALDHISTASDTDWMRPLAQHRYPLSHHHGPGHSHDHGHHHG